jgi:hypothetical protein
MAAELAAAIVGRATQTGSDDREMDTEILAAAPAGLRYWLRSNGKGKTRCRIGRPVAPRFHAT